MVGKIKFKIDEKSLYYGIYNDYERGETATVHTPINQSKYPEKWHHDILELTKHSLHSKYIPDMLTKKCLPKTTSDAESKLNYFYEFKNLKLDGVKLECDTSFAMYIKEEISEFITSRKGVTTRNTHLGRLKLHYPTTLLYKSDGFNVDNLNVLKCILKQNKGFAYVVRSFEYSFDDDSLNFITTMVGPENICLSSVFKKKKGTGKKLLLNAVDSSDIEFIQDYITINKPKITNISDVFDLASKAKVENGKLGEQIIMEMLSKQSGVDDLYHTSKDYATSPYDIEYIENGVKKYVEVKATQGKKKVFNMSCGEIKFMNSYANDYMLYLITEVKDDYKIYKFNKDSIMKLDHECTNTRFFAK